MDTSKEYIKMCDCPEVQGTIHDWRDRKTHWGLNKEEKAVWLPRQDQIQEMHGWKHAYTFHRRQVGYTGNMIDDWNNLVHGITMDSMEQLWLAFYMYEKHGLTWNETGWIKHDEK